LVGDFFQLPPVVKTATENGFAYHSPAWKRTNLFICYLTGQYRQDDSNFLALLSAIRRNVFGGNHLRDIEARKIEPQTAPNGAPKLFSHNADVDRVNDEILAKLPGKSQIFTMSSQGPSALVAALKRGCLSPETLHLKVGTAVMFTKNNPKDGFVNGTLGLIEGFAKHNNCPIVKMRNGRRVEVKTMSWAMEEGGRILARITQLPLRLAWAITVHKSQGMSLDEAVMDLSDVFEFGQGYVALSRVRRLSGLFLLGWNERAFQVHPEVLAKDAEFRELSEQSSRAFDKVGRDEITAMQKRFIRACGGKIVPEIRAGAQEIHTQSGFEKIREKHASAYWPWDKAQDEKLRGLFVKGLSVADLAITFNRTSGAIRSRLAKLGL
ncbi:MAG: PIF1 family ATP-dependent DNA helicase, partial [bacterium]|nr:PIF1 family ATP-dependent DNA helicase [bacterium]